MSIRISVGLGDSYRKLVLGLALLVLGSSVEAADPSVSQLGREARSEVIGELAESLREVYVFADKAEAMASAVESRLQGGSYAAETAPEQLAARLTHDLRSVTDDKHLRVFELPPETHEHEDDLARARRQYEERAWRENYGFRLVQVLDGNIGYLELKKFADPSVAGDTATAAMAMLAHSEALIIDLRQNHGGSPFMVQLLASYLLEEAPQHLVDQYVRSSDSTRQIHSLTWVPGKRLPEIDVFILTSIETFSAAEGFTYMLQNLKRATVIGERSAGGAHPVRVVSLGHGLAAAIPFARAINPITGTNWEGVGVEPDIEVPADDAFGVAYAKALEALAASAEDRERRAELEQLLATREQK